MDYKKKYNEAQKWIESIYSELSHEQQMEAEAFFPELKESENELTWLTKYIEEEAYSLSMDIRDNEDRIKLKKLQRSLIWLEKQGEKSSIFAWHSVSEAPDEMRELLCEWETDDAIWHDVAFYDAKTNKFRQNKMPIDNVTRWTYIDELLEKQDEQKPTDEIEPKFHEGEWITNGDYTWKIVEVKPLDYILQSQEGNIVDDTISHVDEQFHSFTIKDAKDGDVLACPLPKGCESGEQIFIFKGINSRDYVDNCIEYYCRICEGVFYENENGYMGTTSSPLYPATKEQRDTLFAKMTEAGYEWDTEKKELKKMSQRMVSAEAKEALYDKPAWSEEDDVRLQACLDTLQAKSLMGVVDTNMTKWLKSLKDRYTWKPAEEQMRALHDMNLTGNISYVGQAQVLIELYNDLKKLTE